MSKAHPIPLGKDMEETILDRVLFNKTNKCWEWVPEPKRPYGRLRFAGREIGAHVASYLAFCGPIPEGTFVCHDCDNPRCVNPTHLWLGSHVDNMKDCTKKRRRKMGRQGAHNRKLTGEQVREIVAAYAEGSTSQKSLAEKYSVGETAIGYIVAGRTFREITGGVPVVANKRKHNTYRIDDAQSEEIASLYLTGEWTQEKLAEKFGVTQSAISALLRRKTKKHVNLPELGDILRRQKAASNASFTFAEAEKIRDVYASGVVTQQELADQIGVSDTTIGEVVTYAGFYASHRPILAPDGPADPGPG